MLRHPYADMGSVRHSEIVIERAEDVWVWDSEGTATSTRPPACGTRMWPRPVRDRVPRSPRKWSASAHTRPSLTSPTAGPRARGALAELAPMPAKVFFGSGGSDGIDTAAKLARRYWWALGQPDRTVLVSRTAGYHGTHGFGTALGGIPATAQGFGPQADTIQVRHDSLEALEQTSHGSVRSESRRCSWNP